MINYTILEFMVLLQEYTGCSPDKYLQIKNLNILENNNDKTINFGLSKEKLKISRINSSKQPF